MPADGRETARWKAGDLDTGRLRYEVVDVFSARPFAGNPLAVVYGADALTSEQMLALATEFNLSETTFPTAPTSADRAVGADYRLRIFTPGGEVPFAGHPTLGTAWALRQCGTLASGDVTQACGAGLIAVRLPPDPGEAVELGAAPRDAARRLTQAEVAAVVALVGLTVHDVVGSAYLAGCGLTWLYLPVSPEAVSRSRPSTTQLAEVALDRSALIDPVDGIDVYAVGSGSAGAGSGLRIVSRVFVPGFGIPEDPATGSAAVGLGLVLVATGQAVPDGETSYRIEQGVEMGRPSVLTGRVEASAGSATRAYVAGHVVSIAEGTIEVPPLLP